MTALPAEFADLERYADWCLPTERERYEKRIASTIPQMHEFYEAITARAEDALTYCDGFPIDELPPEALNLFHMLLSMVMVSFPVEVWHQPRVPDSGVTSLDCIAEPVP